MTNEVRSEPPKESAVMLPNDPETQIEAVRRQHGVHLLLHLCSSSPPLHALRSVTELDLTTLPLAHQIPLDEVVLGELVALGRRFSVPFPPLLSSASTAAKL
jgi:hypothetical protein